MWQPKQQHKDSRNTVAQRLKQDRKISIKNSRNTAKTTPITATTTHPNRTMVWEQYVINRQQWFVKSN